ncbi:hypothetical protein ACWDKQ_25980 [Saccharopolyspora sp. NPDC000995]
MNILLDRFPRLRTDPENPPLLMPVTNLIGANSLPLLTRQRFWLLPFPKTAWREESAWQDLVSNDWEE